MEIEENELKQLLESSFITGYGYCSFDIVGKKIEPGTLNFKKIKEEFNKAYPEIIRDITDS